MNRILLYLEVKTNLEKYFCLREPKNLILYNIWQSKRIKENSFTKFFVFENQKPNFI